MTGVNPLPRLTRSTTAVLLGAALATTPALGQFQVQGGTALDANQQVGSGGVNATGQQVDYQARNLLITGNVGGGRAFQGQIDYTAVGAFQGSLGSDALFNFRRDSIYSSPGAIGAAGLRTRGAGGLDRLIVARPTTSIPGFAGGAGYAQSTRTSYDPSSGVVSFRGTGGALVALTGVGNVRDLPNYDPTTSLGLVNTPQGLVSIDASPLTGVQYNPLQPNPSTLNPLDNLQPDRPELDEEDPLNPDLTPGRRIDGRANPGEQEGQGEEENELFNLPEDPLTVTLGMQVQSAMSLQLAGRVDNNIPNAQAQAIRERVFGKQQQATDPTQPPKAPENPYDKLIADILAQADPIEPGTEPEPEPVDPDAEDTRPRWQQILDEPEKAIRDAKRDARDIALRQSLGLYDEEGNIDFEADLPTIDPDSELGKLLSELAYDLPRVDTFAGQDENRINNLLARGEQELKDGRYTVAESIYRQVLRETKGNPLAKAGLIHSQMGAGMIRSSAFNLRGLFSDHPELIALRYDTKLLPDTERLRWLQGRLQKQIADNNPGSEPGLILAYLGYQLEAKPLVEFGLTVAEAEAPRDPLMPVLRKIWLEGGDAKEAEGEDTTE